NEAPLRVEALRLRNRVEDAEIGYGVSAGGCAPLPATVVGGQVAVYQVAHEMPLALAPVDQQVLAEEHGHDHAQAVVHPAGVQQLAHGCVDDREAGTALLPGFKVGRGVAPRQSLGLGAEGVMT